MADHLINVKIVQPGRVSAKYYPLDADTLRLERVVYPEVPLPFDVGSLSASLTPFGDPLTVLVLGDLSHPVNTEIEARLLGALRRDTFPYLLAVPTADPHMQDLRLETIQPELRETIVHTLHSTYPGDWHWLSVSETEPHLHAAALAYRKAKEASRHPHLDPAWKPVHLEQLSPHFDATERYTPAEYTFFELAPHFRHYVQEYLAPEERILYAVPRPALASYRKRGWLEREHLQAGVLILTDQRLIHLAELMPPDNAGIRYGYHTVVGVLERFHGASLQEAGRNSLLLVSEWSAGDGHTTIEWEVPGYTRPALEQLLGFLQAFRADDPSACLLRRATLPPAAPELPPLRDNSQNDASLLLPLNKRFSALLAAALQDGEQARAWALIPDWFSPHKTAEVLIVTEKRLFTLPEPKLDLPLTEIGTLEYTGSILDSSLAVNVHREGKLLQKVVTFPYPAEAAFHACFEAARRCLAVGPLR